MKLWLCRTITRSLRSKELKQLLDKGGIVMRLSSERVFDSDDDGEGDVDEIGEYFKLFHVSVFSSTP